MLAARGYWEWRPPQAVLFASAVSPAVAALALTAARHGRRGVAALLGRLVAWRVAPGWYAAALLLPFALAAAGRTLAGPLQDGGVAPRAIPLPSLLATFAGWMLAVPVEELGWRGYALPRLQARWNALTSGALLGVVWGVWHVPVLLLQTARAPGGLGLVVASVVVASLLMTWLYNGSGGSLLVASVFHASVNTTAVALPVTPGTAVAYSLVVTALGAAVVAAVLARHGAADMGPRPRVTA